MITKNDYKWLWMMKYCRKHNLSPAQLWAWNKAAKAYKGTT